MKTFALMSRREQRDAFLRGAHRSYLNKLASLKDDYEGPLSKALGLEIRAHALNDEVTRLENQVANKADVEFGSDRVWRVSRTLLKKVVKRMDKVSAHLREKQERWREEARRLKQPFNREVNALTRLYKRVVLSVQRT